jgi:hypothetical protein
MLDGRGQGALGVFKKKTGALILTLGVVCAAVRADEPTPHRERVATVLGGVGNDLGWFGFEGEKYLHESRVSAFAGVGYAFRLEAGQTKGPAGAVGIRVFTSGKSHRAFSQLSLSQLAAEVVRADSTSEGSRFYGPGLQVGYQFVGERGGTFLVSGGLGYAFGTTGGVGRLHGMLNIAVGQTWSR